MTGDKRILVTQGHLKHSLAIVQHLGAMGYEVHALFEPTDTDPLVSHSRRCSGVHPVAQLDEAQFMKDTIELLRTMNFDVLIPVGFPVTRFVARGQEQLSQLTGLCVPTAVQEESAGNKLFTNNLAERLGVGAPHTKRVLDVADLESTASDFEYPLIIKGPTETGKGIVARVDSQEQLRPKYENLVQKFGLNTPEQLPILQEFIHGWGCGFFATYDHGECRRVFMHRRVREFPATGGSSSCAEAFRDPSLADSGIKLLDELKWNGVAMVEFRYDERSDTFKLVEINPKFWGSLELALRAGADFVHDYVRLALGEKLDFHDDYKMIRFQWFLDGDLQHARQNRANFGAVLADLLNPAVHKNFFLNDTKLLRRRLKGTS